MKSQEEAQTYKHKRHSQKCCVVDTRAWPEAEAMLSAWQGLGHRAPFDTAQSPTPFFWDGSSVQPCQKNYTVVSGTCSNNNKQWGLLSLIKPLPVKRKDTFWEFSQLRVASSWTSLQETIELQVACGCEGKLRSRTGQSGREKHFHTHRFTASYTWMQGEERLKRRQWSQGSVGW